MRHAKLFSLTAVLASLSTLAVAADLPPRPVYKAPAAVVAQTWTGIYVGGHAGYGRNRFRSVDLVLGEETSETIDGFVGGGQVGANYQIGSIVLGVEGEYSYARLKQTTDDPLGAGGSATFRNDYFATAGGRLGYAMNMNRTLVYAKGGAAWTQDKFDLVDATGTATGRWNRTGWFVGGGVEWMLMGNWTAKIEYDYLRFGAIDEAPATTGGIAANPASVKLETHIVKAGINYLFRGI